MQFSEIKTKTAELVDTVHGLNERLGDLGTVASAVGGELDLLSVANVELAAVVNKLAAESSDPAILAVKAEVDLLETERALLKSKTDRILVALE